MGPIRIVRHAQYQTRFFDIVLMWIAQNAPEVAAHFDVRNLPCELGPGARLLVPWLQDPVQAWSQETYDFVAKMQAECDALGVPVVNRVEKLTNAGKAKCAEIVASTGLRTPRMSRITDAAAFRRDFGGLAFPLFVREDWVHQSVIYRADNPEEARNIPIERYKHPLAVEVVDLRNPDDGLFRKFRYFAAGERGIPHHLQISQTWITRGDRRVLTDATRDEELAYLAQPDRFHDRFQAACRALGLDLLALDYGIDANGEPVVWEVNPFMHIEFGKVKTVYRNHAIHRSVAAMVALYLERAGFGRTPKIDALLAY